MVRRISKKVIGIGSSSGITLDKEFMRDKNIEEGDTIVLDYVMLIKKEVKLIK